MVASSYISIAGNNRSCAQFVFFAAPLGAGWTVTEKKQLVLRGFNCGSRRELQDSRMQYQVTVEMRNHLVQDVLAKRMILLSALWHPWPYKVRGESQQNVPYYRWSWPYQFCLLKLKPRKVKANERVECECKTKQEDCIPKVFAKTSHWTAPVLIRKIDGEPNRYSHSRWIPNSL